MVGGIWLEEFSWRNLVGGIWLEEFSWRNLVGEEFCWGGIWLEEELCRQGSFFVGDKVVIGSLRAPREKTPPREKPMLTGLCSVLSIGQREFKLLKMKLKIK